MTTRQRILATPETLSHLELAAEDRFRDAVTLLRGGRNDGAVYLFGIAAEMWLKIACFRADGHGPGMRVAGLLVPAYRWMKFRAPLVRPEGYHNLSFWGEYLVLRRREAKFALPAGLLGELRHHVDARLSVDWKIDLRYRHLSLDERSARRVYQDASWVRANHAALWR